MNPDQKRELKCIHLEKWNDILGCITPVFNTIKLNSNNNNTFFSNRWILEFNKSDWSKVLQLVHINCWIHTSAWTDTCNKTLMNAILVGRLRWVESIGFLESLQMDHVMFGIIRKEKLWWQNIICLHMVDMNTPYSYTS